MDKEHGLWDEFVKVCKRFFLIVLLVLLGCNILYFYLARSYFTEDESNNSISNPHPSNVRYEGNTHCDCVRLIVDDMRAENMTFLQIQQVEKEVWEFTHRYRNGTIDKYTHEWK